MLLSDLYKKLSYGELSNLALSSDGSGTILDEKKPVVVGYLNSALLQLFTKFNMRQNDCIIELQEGLSNYFLLKKFAEFAGKDDPSTSIKYILDNQDQPFQDDVIKILSVSDTHKRNISLNDSYAHDGIFTPQFNQLQVTRVIPGMPLNVIYQARHPEIDGSDESVLIDIPYVLEEALIEYIAFKVYQSMNSETSSASAQQHFASYNAICNGITSQDAVGVTESNTSDRFENRGWV